MLELLFVWVVIAQSGVQGNSLVQTYGWQLLAETTNCKATAEQLGYTTAIYRCVKK